MKILTVVTHPRINSLTFQVAKHFVKGVRDSGNETEILDLYRSSFNPVLWESDEPDWHSDQQIYSQEVEKEMNRLMEYDSLAFIFPLWWWSMPAMLKGYIDRVWNYGFAYGPNKLKHQQVLWLSLAGAPKERFEKRQYDTMIDHYFNVGLASYCGIPNSKVKLLYDTVGNPTSKNIEKWLNQAYEIGFHYTHRPIIT
ncbi:NAD(P)H oxidoreductase [Pseudalkalibacillus salsuginis]|uniref:NAD(P)H oxidoreductase n=1 Tax=Pseudalkalibacillus salsuginis TaxID=2910972 RepID=UPI001F43022F|nr:NAD(P)H oxidoreductase [Pseudalkalibacillus salsuginis]MCF6410291.1 NAD(P)H oxidoreductase [Pseudalkalibacillus salsuginis]